MLRNFSIRFSNPRMARTTAKDNSSKFKFIANEGRSGSIFDSLKYLIIESKTTLLI